MEPNDSLEMGPIELNYSRELATEKSADQMIHEFESENGAVEPVDPATPEAAQQAQVDNRPLTSLEDVLMSAPAGVPAFVQDSMNGLVDVKNFVMGTKLTAEQRKKDRFDFADRNFHEPQTLPGHAAKAAVEFLTGTAALSKALPMLPAAGVAGAVAMAGKGFVTDFIMSDPEKGNISKLLMDHGMKNVVTEFLASDPNDSAALTRLKGGLEGLIPGALIGSVMSGLKWYKGRQIVSDMVEAAPKADAKAASTTPPEAGTGVAKVDPKASVEAQMVESLAKDQGITVAEAKKRMVVLDGKPHDFSPLQKADGAAFLERRTGALSQPDLPEKAFNINLTNLRTSDDIKEAISVVADLNAKNLKTSTRGVVPHESTIKDASELLRTDLAFLMNRETGQAMNAAQLTASRQVMVMASQNLVEKANIALKSGSDIDRAAFMQSLNAHAAIQAQVSGATAEAGRALNAMKILAKADTNDSRNRAIKILLQQGGGRTSVDKMLKALEDISKSGDPVQTAKAIANWQSLSLGGRWVEGIYEARRGLMLTGVSTNVLNVTSNALNVPIRVVEKKLAERVAKRAGVAPKSVKLTDSVAQGEAAAEVNGLFSGLRDGLVLASQNLRNRTVPGLEDVTKAIRAGGTDPHPMVNATEANFNRFSWGSLAPENKSTRKALETLQVARAIDAIGSISRTGFNVMGGADDLFKAINYRMGIHAAAHREATRLGLTGADHAARVRDLIQTPVRDVADVGLADSLKWTFNEPLNGAYAKWDSAIKNSPARWLMPFTRTNFNVFDYTLQNIPAVRNLSGNLLNDLKAGGTRAQMAQARMQVGNVAVMMGAGLAAAGLLRGGGPSDPKTRKSIGWDPYSIKVGDTWVSIGRSHPLAKVLGMGADVHDMVSDLSDGKPDRQSEIITTAAALAAHGVTPEFMVQTLGDFLEIYDGSNSSKTMKIINRMANPVAFTGIVRDVRRAADPVKRDSNAEPVTPYNDDAARAWDEAKSTFIDAVPFWSKSLPAQLDVFGEEVPWEAGISGVVVAAHKQDPVKEEILGLRLTDDIIADRLAPGDRELALQLPPRILTNGGVSRELDAQQYHDLVMLSSGKPVKGVSSGMKPLKDSLAEMMAQPWYKSASDQMKRIQIAKKVSIYQSTGRALLPQLYPELNQDLINDVTAKGKALVAPPTRKPNSSTGSYPTLR